MPNAAWPVTLPQAVLVGDNDAGDFDYNIRTSMAVGPAKVRPRCTTYRSGYRYAIKVTAAQWATLTAFYRTTLINGTQLFDWVDAVDNTTKTYVFSSPPQRTNIGPNLWQVNLNVEDP